MYFTDKITPGGYNIRTYPAKAKYLVYKDKKYLEYIRQGGEPTTWFPLQHLIFIGESFNIYSPQNNYIGLYKTNVRQTIVPFAIKGMSDIRHIYVPVFCSSDMIPVRVHHFKSSEVGLAKHFLKDKLKYFILEPEFGKDLIIDLKNRFPNSKVIIYHSDEVLPSDKDHGSDSPTDFFFIQDSNEYVEEKKLSILHRGNIASLTQNPVYLAIYYLKNEELDALYDLPLTLSCSAEDVRFIHQIINIKLKERSFEKINADLEANADLYDSLVPFMSRNFNEIDEHLDKNILDEKLVPDIVKILTFQKKYLRGDISDDNIRSFFDYALSKLKKGEYKK